VSAPGRIRARIPFTGRSEDFDWFTDAGLRAATDNPDNVFGAVLGLLAECRPSTPPSTLEGRGPTYAQLRAVADALAMTPEQGEEWELLAESIPLAERHVLRILGALADAHDVNALDLVSATMPRRAGRSAG
jgi:hypothetical protein